MKAKQKGYTKSKTKKLESTAPFKSYLFCIFQTAITPVLEVLVFFHAFIKLNNHYSYVTIPCADLKLLAFQLFTKCVQAIKKALIILLCPLFCV